MTEEVIEQESTQEQDDAAFSAGFAEARGDEPPTEAPASEPVESQQEDAPATETSVEAEPAAEEPLYAGLTESQLKAQLAKIAEVDEVKAQVRQAFGKLGELNQKLMAAQSATAKLNPGQLKRLSSEYPELAALLEEDLGSIAVGQSPSFDPEPIRQELEQKFSGELERMRREQELKMLSMRHADWQTIRSSDDFRIWEQTLPQDERQKLNDSWDALYVSTMFDQYKAWREKAHATKHQKNQRLAAAVTPTGVPKVGHSTTNDDDAFLAGFKQARGG